MPHPWTWLIMLSPNTKTFLICLVFVLLLLFLISSLLELSVDILTFGAPFCRVFSELIVGNLSREFSLVICTGLLKTLLQLHLLGELSFRFPFDNNFNGGSLRLVFWYEAFVFVLQRFNVATVTNWLMYFFQILFTTNICLRKKVLMSLFRHLTTWPEFWNHIRKCYLQSSLKWRVFRDLLACVQWKDGDWFVHQ